MKFSFSPIVIFSAYPKTSLTLEVELEGSQVTETQRKHLEEQKEPGHPAALNQPPSGYAKALEPRNWRRLSSSSPSQSRPKLNLFFFNRQVGFDKTW